VINRDGYDGTDTNRIAREAGYSPGTFYKHFTDKKEVFVSAYKEWVAEEWRTIEHLLEKNERVDGAARDLVTAVLDLHRRWRGLRRALRVLASTDSDVRRAYLAQRSEQLDTMARLRFTRQSVREADAMLLYQLERTADAIADDESEALGLDRDVLIAQLVEAVVKHIHRA
jgi:AcrR family transcriptional regulator